MTVISRINVLNFGRGLKANGQKVFVPLLYKTGYKNVSALAFELAPLHL